MYACLRMGTARYYTPAQRLHSDIRTCHTRRTETRARLKYPRPLPRGPGRPVAVPLTPASLLCWPAHLRPPRLRARRSALLCARRRVRVLVTRHLPPDVLLHRPLRELRHREAAARARRTQPPHRRPQNAGHGHVLPVRRALHGRPCRHWRRRTPHSYHSRPDAVVYFLYSQ